MTASKRPRASRLRTIEKILVGARAAMVERGWQDWGINAVAARSGVQKVLIYRYFGGMDGLARALAENLSIFPIAPDNPGPEALIRHIETHWHHEAFARYVARLRPLLGLTHPFADAFDQQRARLTTALKAALRQDGRDPAEAPIRIALLLDSVPGRDVRVLPLSVTSALPSRVAEDELPVELL